MKYVPEEKPKPVIKQSTLEPIVEGYSTKMVTLYRKTKMKFK